MQISMYEIGGISYMQTDMRLLVLFGTPLGCDVSNVVQNPKMKAQWVYGVENTFWVLTAYIILVLECNIWLVVEAYR